MPLMSGDKIYDRKTPKRSIRVDDTSVANTHYIGLALSGTADSDPRWRIRRFVMGSDGFDETRPNGSDAFGFVWDDRLTLDYS